MMTPKDLLEIYTHAITTLDTQVADIKTTFQDQMQCKKGCSQCCETGGFRIRWVEALTLFQALEGVASETRAAIQENLAVKDEEGQRRCPLLVDGACSVYESRPALCRAYGVVLRLDEDVSTCSLNFTNIPALPMLQALDLNVYYELLDELSSRLWQMRQLGTVPPRQSIRAFLQTAFFSDV